MGPDIHRVGGISALAIAAGYLVIIPLYVAAGAPPTGGEAWVAYAAGKTTVWWAILGLSVLTDLLFVPLALSLYRALEVTARDAMVLAAACIVLFVGVDLAVTWSNYAVLISIADRAAAAATDSQRAADLAAATYAATMLSTRLEGVYSIAILSVGILITGFVMQRSGFGRAAWILGVATGVLGLLAVVGPLVASSLGLLAILASVLTTAWLAVVGFRLLRLGSA